MSMLDPSYYQILVQTDLNVTLPFHSEMNIPQLRNEIVNIDYSALLKSDAFLQNLDASMLQEGGIIQAVTDI